MSHPHLKDAIILIVEDEPLIILDISMAFENTGAHLTTTNSVKHAKLLIEDDGLSGVILDHALADGDSNSLSTRLLERNIPFLIYSGFKKLDGPAKDAPHLSKPASHKQLRDTVEALIRDFKTTDWPTALPALPK
jgi:DNA-binding NtrC family response regulator